MVAFCDDGVIEGVLEATAPMRVIKNGLPISLTGFLEVGRKKMRKQMGEEWKEWEWKEQKRGGKRKEGKKELLPAPG